jgi:Two component regulator propeller
MRHHIFVAVILLFSTVTNLFGQTFSECSIHGPLFTRVEQPPTFAGSLQEYFEKELAAMFQDFNGTIKIQILIDTGGKACCMNVDNNSSGVSSEKIKDAVNKMTGWTAAKQNNHFVNFSAMLQITFNSNSKLSVNYTNEKQLVLKPVINPNTSNHPDIVKERKTKSVWKLWNFFNSMIPADLSRSVAMDSNGVIWYCTDHGLVRIADDDHWQIFSGLNVQALAGRNNFTRTTGMNVDKANNVWVQSFDYILKFDGKQWTRFDTTNSPLKFVRKICVDKNGVIWFCTFRGLIKYDGKDWAKFDTANSKIASDNVEEVYVGNDETIWIATDKGINKVANGKWDLFNSDNTKIPENDVTSIKGDLKGNIWAGLGTRGNHYLMKIDSSGAITVFPSGVIWNITVDNNAGKVWLATNGNGLVSFDGNEFTQYDMSNSIIPNNTVTDVLIDNNGNKWISTFGGLVFTNKK